MSKTHTWTVRLLRSFCVTGLLAGTLFFAGSLTPSLVPRTPLLQGFVSGIAFAAGYGIGHLGSRLWRYLEVPVPRGRARLVIQIGAVAICLPTAATFLLRAADWQDAVRLLAGMEPVSDVQPLTVGAIAFLVFFALLAVARLFRGLYRIAASVLRRFLPPRVAATLGATLAAVLLALVIDGLIFRATLRALDASLAAIDEMQDRGMDQSSDPVKTGSPASLVDWMSLGRHGRIYVSSGPTREDLKAFWKADVKEPLRVYVGLRSAETIEERAKLALAELKRVHAFDRSVLIIATPTGNGWLDPAAMNTVEYLHAGDIATVAMQYSYLWSWLSLLVEPGYGIEAARALFDEVYDYWRTLPRDTRPKLYLHGMSLGALSSESSADFFDVLADPYHGALWSGPPFASKHWRHFTRDRNPDSPVWLPRFRNGSIVRFTNQENALAIPGATWGPTRIVYLQYASDPITFVGVDCLYKEPDWMKHPRGPDVSPELRWYPIVTFLQLITDSMVADQVPAGFGHSISRDHYIDAWVEVTDPPNWTAADSVRLKQHLRR